MNDSTLPWELDAGRLWKFTLEQAVVLDRSGAAPSLGASGVASVPTKPSHDDLSSCGGRGRDPCPANVSASACPGDRHILLDTVSSLGASDTVSVQTKPSHDGKLSCAVRGRDLCPVNETAPACTSARMPTRQVCKDSESASVVQEVDYETSLRHARSASYASEYHEFMYYKRRSLTSHVPPPFVPTCDHQVNKGGYHRSSCWLALQRKADAEARAIDSLRRSRVRAARRDPQFALRLVRCGDVPVAAVASIALPPSSPSRARSVSVPSPRVSGHRSAVVSPSHGSSDSSPQPFSSSTFSVDEQMVAELKRVSRRVVASRPSRHDSQLDHHLRIGSVFAAIAQLEEIVCYRQSAEAQCAVDTPSGHVLASHQDFVTYADCLLNDVIPPGGSAATEDAGSTASSSSDTVAPSSPAPSSPAPSSPVSLPSPIRDGTVPPSPEEAMYDDA